MAPKEKKPRIMWNLGDTLLCTYLKIRRINDVIVIAHECSATGSFRALFGKEAKDSPPARWMDSVKGRGWSKPRTTLVFSAGRRVRQGETEFEIQSKLV